MAVPADEVLPLLGVLIASAALACFAAAAKETEAVDLGG